MANLICLLVSRLSEKSHTRAERLFCKLIFSDTEQFNSQSVHLMNRASVHSLLIFPCHVNFCQLFLLFPVQWVAYLDQQSGLTWAVVKQGCKANIIWGCLFPTVVWLKILSTSPTKSCRSGLTKEASLCSWHTHKHNKLLMRLQLNVEEVEKQSIHTVTASTWVHIRTAFHVDRAWKWLDWAALPGNKENCGSQQKFSIM